MGESPNSGVVTTTIPKSWGGEGNLPGATVDGGVVKRGVVLAAYVVRDGGVKRVIGSGGGLLSRSPLKASSSLSSL